MPAIAGTVGGLVGAAVWAAIAYFTGYEVGWIAVGIGALVGFAVRQAQTLDADDLEDAVAGMLAGAIAVGAVLVGKYATLMLLLGNVGGAGLDPEELAISYLADEVVMEFQEEGRVLSWPSGITAEDAFEKADYPAEVWSEAEKRWYSLSEEDREFYRAEANAFVAALSSQSGTAMMAMFTPFDLLWFGLAGWTAFKMGGSGEA